MSESEQVKTSGVLSEGVLPGVLRMLYVGRRTGLLHVTHRADRGSVCFIDGHIVWGDTTIPECHMGETLVRHGLLSQEDLERAAARRSESRKRLGQILVEMGILDQGGLEDALALHVREILRCIFQWSEGDYEFEERPPEAFRGHDQALNLSTGEVILDAVWSIGDPDVLRYALGDIEQVLTLTNDPLLRFQRVTFTPTDGYILSRVDGTLSAREILAITPVPREEAERSLLGLICTGIIGYAAEKAAREPATAESERRTVLQNAYRGLSTQDHFQVLGVPRGAAADEIKTAYFRLAKLFHPDAQHDPSMSDLRTQIQAVFSRLSEAYRILSDLDRRTEYERALGRGGEPERPPVPMPRPTAVPAPAPAPTVVSARAAAPPTAAPSAMSADEALRRADEAVEAGRHWEAIPVLEECLQSARGIARRRAHVLLAACHLKSSDGGKAAERQLIAAIKEDAANAEAFFQLGRIYREAGLAARAAAMFRRTVELKPRHAGALSELSSLPASSEPPEPGLLKRLFG